MTLKQAADSIQAITNGWIDGEYFSRTAFREKVARDFDEKVNPNMRHWYIADLGKDGIWWCVVFQWKIHNVTGFDYQIAETREEERRLLRLFNPKITDEDIDNLNLLAGIVKEDKR